MKLNSTKSKIVTIILVVVCIALAAIIVYKLFIEEEEVRAYSAPVEASAVNVYAEAINESEFIKTVRLYGRVENLARDVQAVTTISGYVTEVLVEKGDEVHAGDTLGYIDSSTAGASFKAAPIKAKVAGVVDEVNASVGLYLQNGSIFLTIEPEPDYVVNVNVPEKYIFDVKLGGVGYLSSSLDATRQGDGYVTYIDDSIAAATNTFSIELKPTSSERLREGMTITVDLVTRELANAFVVPMESISATGDGTYLYIVEGNNARLRKVELGENNSNSYVITSGLNGGELVIVEGSVTDGALVNVVEEIK